MSEPKIPGLLTFQLTGKIAHFKKYYSNISSLTYEVPPRTVITGILASILEMPRDTYYETFSPQQSKIGVQLLSPVRKQVSCMNYVKKEGGPTQVRLELLLPREERLRFRIYCWHENAELFDSLFHRCKNHNLGYGVYLGQRAFRGYVEDAGMIPESDIQFLTDFSGKLDSLTFEENISGLSDTVGFDINSASMPNTMRKIDVGREQDSMVNTVFEMSGKGVPGRFKEAFRVRDKTISFYTPFVS
ncbi:MAG: CRISPR-associated protein Cas5 [Candidatus Marinimicrobia bacterium]|nr:CRISPR-associated protein Cas5 [Candidatus Neomarinimicrobiota bacterium]MCF7828060.1 CRISPR-associated protein Cas5 [Candidatus Neomarinimicrobiota bacterium]MCF7879185.1 CRISPR-associated protein Cas5 [Candidatus Neomarinimicrobiota bacterium]